MSNIVILTGHIGHDLELKTTNTSGKAVLNFRMATNRKFNNGQQQLDLAVDAFKGLGVPTNMIGRHGLIVSQ